MLKTVGLLDDYDLFRDGLQEVDDTSHQERELTKKFRSCCDSTIVGPLMRETDLVCMQIECI